MFIAVLFLDTIQNATPKFLLVTHSFYELKPKWVIWLVRDIIILSCVLISSLPLIIINTCGCMIHIGQ